MRRWSILIPLIVATPVEAQTFKVEPAGTGAIVTDSAIFLEGLAPAQLPVSLQLDLKKLGEVIPVKADTFAMVNFQCSVLRHRRLSRCKTNLEPAGKGYESAAALLLRNLQIDSDWPIPRQPLRFVSVQIKLWNSNAPVTFGPCWPPICSSILPPPPPFPTVPSGR